VYGASLTLSSPRFNDRIFMSLGAWYIHKIYKGHNEDLSNVGIGITVQNKVSIDVSFLRVPFGFGIFLKDPRSSPYFRLGLAQSFWLHDGGVDLKSETDHNGVVTNTSSHTGVADKIPPLGFWGAIGYQKQIGALPVFAEIRYELNDGFVVSSVSSTSNCQNLNVIIGVKF